MIDFKSFIYHQSRIPQNAEEREQFFKDLEQSFLDEIHQSDKARAFLNQFLETDIESFLANYVRNKVNLIQSYEYYDFKYREHENYELNFHKRAEVALQAIQQKKLFNLQLKWRADQVKIEGIDICYDFIFWEKHIASCPFIPRVTDAEKELMKEYLLTKANDTEDEILKHMYPSWQDYDVLTQKDELDTMNEMIDWYEFFDDRMGTGVLLSLPDTRGKKENFYREINFADRNTKKEVVQDIDTRPRLIGFGANFIAFASVIESDMHMIQLYKGYEITYNKENKIPYPERVEFAVNTLHNADRQIHLPAHLNWDEAIIYGAKQYTNIKIAEALDVVYDEYCIFQELGMSITESRDEIAQLYKDDQIVNIYRQSILNGRVKNGEAGDFNF